MSDATITRHQLRIQIDRLSDTFHEKYFSEQRELMIWEAVQHCTYNQVIAITDNFIRSFKFAPLPKDFSEAVAQSGGERKRYALGENRPAEMANCWDCADSGFINLSRKDLPEKPFASQLIAMPCHCVRGKQLIEAALRAKHPWTAGCQYSPEAHPHYQTHPVYMSGENP